MKQKAEEKEQKIRQSEEKINQLTNNWKRALADYQNLERRVREEKEQFAKYANAELFKKLLPALDNLAKVGGHLKDKGFDISFKNLWNVFESFGVKQIDALNRGFDPKTMEAIETVEGKEGIVVEVLRNGYSLHDYVLQPALVKVGKSMEEKSGESSVKSQI